MSCVTDKKMSLPLIPIAVISLLLAYFLYQRLRFKLPPGPWAWPIVGNLYDIKPIRFRCFAEWAQEYGPIMSVWLGSTLHVIVSNSELAKEVLKEHDQHLADRDRGRAAAKYFRNGKDLMWADYGPHYVKVKKLCNLELFTPKRLEALRPIREDEVTAMVESIFRDCADPEKKAKNLMVRKYLGEVAFNNITRVVLGKRYVKEEGVVEEEGKEVKAIVVDGGKLIGATISALAEHIPWLRWMFPLEEEAFAKHDARRIRLTRAIMEEHTLSRQKIGAKKHFVDALLTLKHKYDITEDTIIGLLWDMLAAGMDTIAISVEWGMAEVIKNPRVQQKAQEELDRVIGFERVMTEADFSTLSYLQCVAKETLRLHPPTPLMLPHRANANVKVGGYDIPKGSTVHVNVWVVGRDPAVWENPTEFRPERFLEEDVDMKGHDFRLLPFGAGRRRCPGAQLAINLVTSMLGHLLHHFTWIPPKGMKPEEIDMSENSGLVTYMKTPLQAMVIPRLSSNLHKRVAANM